MSKQLDRGISGCHLIEPQYIIPENYLVTQAENIAVFNSRGFCRTNTVSEQDVSGNMDHQEVFNTVMEQCADSRVMIFSDGSVCGGSVGCGACAAVLFPASDNNHPLVETHAVGSKVSSYECEVEGVILGIRMALKYFENC